MIYFMLLSKKSIIRTPDHHDCLTLYIMADYKLFQYRNITRILISLTWIMATVIDQFCSCVVITKASCPDKILWEKLLGAYGPVSLRPVRNHTETTIVSFRMLISQIVEFDERLQQIKISCWLKQQWYDEFLSWDPASNGNVSQLYVPQSDVWVPDITLYDNIDVHFEHVKDILLWISHTGLVTWYTPAILKSSCKVQVRNFPFDVQYCEMTFASWSYDDSELDVVYTNDSDATQNVFHSNGVWHLERVKVTPEKYYFACCKNPWSFLVYSFEMKRSPSFYISNIIVPCILLSLMTMMVFFLPPRSGEKIQLGMTNLLALILFQQLIAESMPPIGDETPIIGIYFMAMITISCLSITVTVTVLSLFHTNDIKAVPNSLKDFTRTFLKCFLPTEKQGSTQMFPANSELSSDEADEDIKMEPLCELQIAPSTSADYDPLDSEGAVTYLASTHGPDTQQRLTSKEKIITDWKEVALVFDKSFGFMLAIATTVVLLYVVVEFIIIQTNLHGEDEQQKQ